MTNKLLREARLWPSRSCALLLMLTLEACVAQDAPSADDEAGHATQALWAESDVKLWPGTTIPVCFQPRGQKGVGTPEWNAATAGIQAVLEREYETIPGVAIDFTGWGVCPNPALGTFANGIRVTVKITGTPGCADGPTCDAGAASYRICDPSAAYPQTGCLSRSGYGSGKEGHVWVPYYRYPPGPALNQVTLHEFGHALGFHHEFLRTDGDHCYGNDNIAGDYVTEYDPDSILNATYPGCKQSTMLSPGDMLGLAVAYPASLRGRSLRGDHAFVVKDGLVLREPAEITMDLFDRGLPGTADWKIAASGSEPARSETGRSVFVGTGGALTLVGLTFTDFKDRAHMLTGSSTPPLTQHAVKVNRSLHTALVMNSWR